MKPSNKIVAIILAAGASSRMGAPKALLKCADGATLLSSQTALLKNSGCDEIAVVVGSGADEIKKLHADLQVTWIENRSWKLGQFSSVQAAIRWSLSSGITGVLILPVDIAGVRGSTVKGIIESAAANNYTDVIIPEYDGRGGHPVYLPQEFCVMLAAADPHSRLDREIEKSKQIRRLPVDDPLIARNINTPEEWNLFLSTYDTRSANS